ncbi:unnamed protein product [Mytilus edulis]|uniref:Uncharacterized protein n=1 Tax=Mytilus edulis TaxID=6550 RepID=A0A8S3UK84_MYTED|nr:unnamed protein product [Mytilus edulis]
MREKYHKLGMWSEFKFWRNRTKHIIDESKRNFYSKMVKDSKASKDLWKCIRSLNPSQQEKPYELLNEDGVKTNNVSDICNVFNKFFTSCVENLRTDRCMSKTHDYAKLNQFVQKKFTKSEQVKFSIPPVTINGLFNEMIKLDINKSTGSDNIGPNFLN